MSAQCTAPNYTRPTFISFIHIFLSCILLPSSHIFTGYDVETTRLIFMLPGLAVYSFSILKLPTKYVWCFNGI